MIKKKEICIKVDENTKLIFDKELVTEIIAEEVKLIISKNSIIELSDNAIFKHSDDSKPNKTLLVSELLKDCNKETKGKDGFKYKQQKKVTNN